MEENEKYNSIYDSETKKYIWFMCKKSCRFHSEEGCTKKRVVRVCAKKGLKNKD